MISRSSQARFAGGALVFPGGKVEEQDRHLSPTRWRGPGLAGWCDLLGVDDERDALGLLVAAVREAFEEVGLLLAVYSDGSPVRQHDLRSESFMTMRDQLAGRQVADWRGWLEDHGLVLDLQALSLWSWWVTPEGSPQRFDTRFFIAQAPADQRASPDAIEATDIAWVIPQDALQAQRRGGSTIIFPTRRNLAALARYPTTGHALEAARSGQIDRRRILPELVRRDGQVLVRHPDESEPEPI